MGQCSILTVSLSQQTKKSLKTIKSDHNKSEEALINIEKGFRTDQPVVYTKNIHIVLMYIAPNGNGWTTCDFFVLFNNISVISGRWEVDKERLCAMELRLWLRKFRLERGSNSVR